LERREYCPATLLTLHSYVRRRNSVRMYVSVCAVDGLYYLGPKLQMVPCFTLRALNSKWRYTSVRALPACSSISSRMSPCTSSSAQKWEEEDDELASIMDACVLNTADRRYTNVRARLRRACAQTTAWTTTTIKPRAASRDTRRLTREFVRARTIDQVARRACVHGFDFLPRKTTIHYIFRVF